MTNILHVYKTYYPDTFGGVEKAISEICYATKDRGFNSRIFCLTPGATRNDIYDGVEVFRVKRRGVIASCDFSGIEAYKEFSQHEQWADIINFHFPWPFADVLNFFHKSKKPKILTYHSDIVKQKIGLVFYRLLMLHMLNSMDVIIATSKNYALSSKVLNINSLKNKIKIIPLGIRDYNDKAIPKKIIKEKYVLALGVLRYYKGLHILLEAASRICGLVVIGGAGPEEELLKKKAKDLALTNVLFLGALSECEKNNLILGSTALILPSHLRSEAYGMVLVEASMFGKPMVTCDIGTGTSFVNENMQTGFVVQANHPGELSNAINALLSDDDLVEKYGKAARARYEKFFSDKALGDSYEDLYRNILKFRKN